MMVVSCPWRVHPKVTRGMAQVDAALSPRFEFPSPGLDVVARILYGTMLPMKASMCVAGLPFRPPDRILEDPVAMKLAHTVINGTYCVL